MLQPIIGYYKDEQGHWVAKLSCHHNQHVRHQPPFINRPWVTTPEGRNSKLGFELNCVKCERKAPKDF
ncbi:DUF3565 domain-containing protein [Saccharobesus litoralis]|uniref:DUF3565 domain-containing protein n=2 Tax=Saccharobesus litoralis TaxID=2172099 RepID=A0A2S0VXL0_9ALTE|nr:DUF3565 domain-containing protein [Saccharobesus litoralis]